MFGATRLSLPPRAVALLSLSLSHAAQRALFSCQWSLTGPVIGWGSDILPHSVPGLIVTLFSDSLWSSFSLLCQHSSPEDCLALAWGSSWSLPLRDTPHLKTPGQARGLAEVSRLRGGCYLHPGLQNQVCIFPTNRVT